MTGFDIPAGQPELRRRARTHPEALAAQRRVLAAPENPAPVRGLAAQSPAEPAIALLDAWAVVADIVSFYSERLATEGYLRTATERRSVRELARTLGHELRPGVSARTELVFTVEDAPGAPGTAVVEAGTPVQSVPGPGEVPQVFETSADLTAHAAWNGMPARASERQVLGYDATEVWLQGHHPGLRRGDTLLVVGEERRSYRTGHGAAGDVERFDLRHVSEALVDPPGHPGWTLLRLDRPLGFLPFRPLIGRRAQRVWHLAERAQLFGATAPDPGLMWQGGQAPLPLGSARVDDRDPSKGLRWIGYELPEAGAPRQLEVDGERPSLVPGSWLVLEQDDKVEAYVVEDVKASGAGRWGLAGKFTRVILDIGDRLERFGRRGATVHCGGVELTAARRRPAGAVTGAVLDLEPFAPLLPVGHAVVVQGVDGSGRSRTETATVAACEVTAEDPLRDPEEPGEDSGEPSLPGVRLTLSAPLRHAYRAGTVVVRGNVVTATHGETVTQVLGSGDGRTAFRSFPLRREPLTHLRATTPAGAAPALELRVDGVRWHEVEHFAGAGPQDRVYRLVRQEGATEGQDRLPTSVLFGDGVHGAIPPTGAENIVAAYRAGIGRDGALDAGQLMLLVRRPLGIREVTNPADTVDWAPPESLDQARATAPQRVRTLDRVVSAGDAADLARAYAGVGQATADVVWDGRTATVVLGIRAVDGHDPTDALLADLAATIDAVRDPRMPVRVLRGRTVPFGLAVEVRTDPDHQPDEVLAAVAADLRRDLGAAAAGFARPVTATAVLLTVRRVPGVQHCTMPRLHRVPDPLDVGHRGGTAGRTAGRNRGDARGGEPTAAGSRSGSILVPQPARWDGGARPPRLRPAELLVLDPTALEIGRLP